MKPSPFSYHRPASVQEAVHALAEHGDEAKVLGGGQSLVPLLNLRLAQAEVLIDINEVGLDVIAIDGDQLHVGALVRHRTLESDPLITTEAPLLREAAPLIGHPPIRVRGTIGGSIAHADPAAELPAVILALDAIVHARSAAGTRKIPAREFFQGPFMTSLEDDELIVGVDIPVHGDHACAYEEVAIRVGDFAVTGVAVALRFVDGHRVADARIAVSGASATPVRADAAEQLLLGTHLEESALREASAAVAAEMTPASDIHGSDAYRRHLADALTRRALVRAGGIPDA